MASQVAQWVKNPPAMQETQETLMPSLGCKDPLEAGMETHSSILGWKIPWTGQPGGLKSIGLQRVWHYWRNWAHIPMQIYGYIIHTLSPMFFSHRITACLASSQSHLWKSQVVFVFLFFCCSIFLCEVAYANTSICLYLYF